MDARQFRKQLSEKLSMSSEEVDALTEGLAMIMRERCGELDTVAIPSFGNFVPVKHDESVETDLSSGRRLLLPPEIVLEVTPSGLLRKHLGHE